MQKFLHVGCGYKRKFQTTKGFNTEAWTEVRFDIDKEVNPDICGSMTDMSVLEDASYDAIYSSHNIEHLFPHEVPKAFYEFHRVLNESGFAIITCPDLKSVCQLVAEDKLMTTVYNSPAGPITPLDMLYGLRPSLERGQVFMAHNCGFTESVLRSCLHDAGFKAIGTLTRGYAPFFDLWAIASKSPRSEVEIKDLARLHLPTTKVEK
jgi:ubiquinone/menaquinone biosynthesis C-methylase UbiE